MSAVHECRFIPGGNGGAKSQFIGAGAQDEGLSFSYKPPPRTGIFAK
jgi:hypothetical protein